MHHNTVVVRALKTLIRTAILALALYGGLDLARSVMAQDEAHAYLPAVASESNESLDARVAALEDLLVHVSREGDAVYITGANVHVVNGEDGTPSSNGLGNVIIGYNEERVYDGANNDRSGSHMLVVGMYNNFSSHGGIVVGNHNTTDGPFSSVSGGTHNSTSGGAASVSGGEGNEAGAYASSITGGAYGLALGDFSSVSGGQSNRATGYSSSVSGGDQNWAYGAVATVGGGAFNEAAGAYSSVSGGLERSATGDHNWRAGDLVQDR